MQDRGSAGAAPLDGIRIVPATDVPLEALHHLYRYTLPAQRLEDQWRWRYRTALPDNPFPLVMVQDGDLLAHAGGIPFRARIGEREYRASWFVDFAVRADLRRRGLGLRLTRAWMEASDLAVTFCNEDSMAVFARLGWIGSLDTRLHVLWVKPFDHPRAGVLGRRGRATMNALAAPALAVLRRRFRRAGPDLRPIGAADLAAFVDAANGPADTVVPIRDAEYWSWRIAGSPDRDLYRLYTAGDVTMLLKLRDDQRSSVDVLWTSDTRDRAAVIVREMVVGLTGWALDHGYSCVRIYASTRAIGEALRPLLPIVGKPRFAFYSADRSLMATLARADWRWHLVDSDFEWI